MPPKPLLGSYTFSPILTRGFGMRRRRNVRPRMAAYRYSEVIRWLGDNDVTTRRMLETILAVEEEHADDLLNLLDETEG